MTAYDYRLYQQHSIFGCTSNSNMHDAIQKTSNWAARSSCHPLLSTAASHRACYEDLSSDTCIAEMIEPLPIGDNVVIVDKVNLFENLNRLTESLFRVDDMLAAPTSKLFCDAQDTFVTKKRKLFTPVAYQSLGEHYNPTKRQRRGSSPSSQANQEDSPSEVIEPRQVASMTDVPTAIEDASTAGESSTCSQRHYLLGHHEAHWAERFQELVEFKAKTGHCFVPCNYPDNPSLVMWVKRQRYQFKLRQEGKHNTLTAARKADLDEIGFVWESHKSVWEDHYRGLCEYYAEHGHVNVPNKYTERNNLGIWVKCQRRQYQLFQKGLPTAMCVERIEKLEKLDFIWKRRASKKSTIAKDRPW